MKTVSNPVSDLAIPPLSRWKPPGIVVIVAGLIAITLLFSAIAAPWLSTHSPTQLDLAHRLEGPSLVHFFGTDELGRDLFSRVLFGARVSLGVSVGVVVTGFLLGISIGSASGLIGGWFDTVLMRLMDTIMAIPPLILAMALAAALGPGLINALIALLIVQIPGYVRLARAQALGLANRPFVESALLSGGSRAHILVNHIIPNAAPPLIVQATLDIGGVMLASAALGFIGLGAQPPIPEWGALIATGQQFAKGHWWYPLFPGFAILFAALAFNILGDELRDRLDPKRGSND